MGIEDSQKRAKAALELLNQDSINFSGFENLRILLKGINPKIDNTLISASKVLKQIENVEQGEIIELSARNLPETTPEQKKRKRLILLFFSFWKDLKSEVERISDTYNSSLHNAGTLAKIATFAKGPFGLTTLVAFVAVGGFFYFSSKFASVTLTNQNCPALSLPTISIPGVKLPSTIEPGRPLAVKVPPFNVLVNANSDNLSVSFLQFKFEYPLQNVEEIVFDGNSLLGKQTQINLSKNHQAYIRCSS